MNVKAVTVSPAKGYETTRYAYTLLYIIYYYFLYLIIFLVRIIFVSLHAEMQAVITGKKREWKACMIAVKLLVQKYKK